MTRERGHGATGEQFELRRAGSRAVITELAGSLRLFEKGGVRLTETYDDDRIPPSACGILLAPWPNRVAEGRWTLDGEIQQLDITEPGRGHAIHGLLRNTGYRLVERSEHRLVLRAEIFPQHGYPFRLSHSAEYSLDQAGDLTVRQELLNLSGAAAPVALGAHPFLRLGDEPADRLTLTVPAARYFPADPQTMIPAADVPVDEQTDLRTGARLAELAMDRAYTGLSAGTGGRVVSTLVSDSGSMVGLWQDETFQYVHIFVTSKYPGRACALAAEPMTAPADSFNSGIGLTWLRPGGSFGGNWGITAQLH
ncbi:aldose epimerase [Arthrobacter sp. CAU 1506]|uniref:aldose 1-epimerase family protein n=1 Tax=Arthrobacter sp. CAU 1506 TaxID=2560052 RepID=UPI0010AD41F1|nr:aldose 1-epimerase family protein [Arthrobacter sp. CAU 1506]TJY72428.1 aldose epimerase [Arthrobacter sp. CAU 1506]